MQVCLSYQGAVPVKKYAKKAPVKDSSSSESDDDSSKANSGSSDDDDSSSSWTSAESWASSDSSDSSSESAPPHYRPWKTYYWPRVMGWKHHRGNWKGAWPKYAKKQ